MILDKILDVDDNFDRTIGHNTPETNSYSIVCHVVLRNTVP